MVKLNDIIDRSHKLFDVVSGDRHERWDDFVGIGVGAIRATVNRSNDFTSNRMMLGREVMMPLDLMLGSDGEELEEGVLIGRILGMAGWRHIERLQKTQPTCGGAVTVVWQTLRKFCLSLPPPAMGARLPFFGVSQ